MTAAMAVTTVGALTTAFGAGVYIHTKWFSNFPPGVESAPRLTFSWRVVVVGLVILAAGILIVVLQKGWHAPGGGGGTGGGGGGAATNRTSVKGWV